MAFIAFQEEKCNPKRIRDASNDMLGSLFDSLSWLYFLRDVKALDRLCSNTSMLDDAKTRLAGAIQEAEAALTAAGVDLEASVFIVKKESSEC